MVGDTAPCTTYSSVRHDDTELQKLQSTKREEKEKAGMWSKDAISGMA